MNRLSHPFYVDDVERSSEYFRKIRIFGISVYMNTQVIRYNRHKTCTYLSKDCYKLFKLI